MIGSVLSLLVAIGPCEPLDPVEPDDALAAVYSKVAREEEARGAPEAAAAAWRMAAAHSPPDSEGHQGLRRLCTSVQNAAAFEAALGAFKSGDCRATLSALAAIGAGAEASAASLLEGICRYELGENAPAHLALTRASADSELEPTANLYLGLLALRRGDGGGALQRLRAAAEGPSNALRSTAVDLLRLANRQERLVVEGSLEGGYDSNATLGAFTTALPGGADDGFGSATVSAVARPWGATGPFLALAGGYRKYVRFPQSDVGLGSGTLGGQLTTERVCASADYGLDFVGLGAAPWLLRHRGTGRALLAIGRFIISAEYGLRYETFFAVTSRGETGFRHAFRFATAVRLGTQSLELSGLITRTQAVAPERSLLESGGELRWVMQATAHLDFSVATAARWRGFDVVDPDLGVTREELQLDGQLRADLDLTDNLSLFLVLDGRQVLANVAALTYTRLGASAGVQFALGAW